MNRLLALVLALHAVTVAVAADVPAKPLTSDVLDIAYLSSRGPLKLRFHLVNDGKPFSVAHKAYTDKVFDIHDRDADGILDVKELANLAAFPFRTRMPAFARAVDGTLSVQYQPLPADKLDSDKDGKVTRDEYAAWLASIGIGPTAVSVRPPEAQPKQLTDALFRHLDKDKDGKLSAAECAAAPAGLESLDGDEDEIISSAELLGQGANGPVSAPPTSDFVPLAGKLDLAVTQMLTRRDKDKSGSLSREETAWPADTFAKHDADGDGSLSPAELTAWSKGSPDLEWITRQGDLSATGSSWVFTALGVQPPKAALAAVEVLASPLKEKTKATEGVSLDLGDAMLTLRGGIPPPMVYRSVQESNFIREQFRALAGEKKYLEKKDIQKDGNLTTVLGVFDAADRDADGRLTLPELEDLMALIARGAQMQATLAITDQGIDVFSHVDANRDGRLGVRELRTFWKRLETLDRDGDGKVGRHELPRQYPIFVERASITTSNDYSRAVLAESVMNQLPSVPRGPVWFQKMDRNRDGDISVREFLGSPTRFRELDADGDGLISVDEAQAAKTPG